MPHSRTVIVAGAGIGGLAAAIALANAGCRVIVLERDREADTSGAGIQLSPNATRTLAALGALEALREKAVEPSELAVANALNGATLASMPLGTAMEARFKSPYLVCLRADLHGTLAKIASNHPAIELQYGAAVADFTGNNSGVTARIERNGVNEEISADALIGADGIRSQIRLKLHAAAHPRHGGISAWRATIPTTALASAMQDKPRVNVWLGPGAHLVHYPVGDGSKINLVAVTTDKNATNSWGEEAAAADVAEHFRTWHATPQSVIATAPAFRRWSIYEAPLLSAWGKGAVTLLGDAAHGMFPFLAQGAASALEDSVTLAHELRNSENVADALRAYERLRLPRTQKMQSAARNVGRIYHLRRPFSFGRDLVMKQIGGEGLLRQNEWIYRC